MLVECDLSMFSAQRQISFRDIDGVVIDTYNVKKSCSTMINHDWV